MTIDTNYRGHNFVKFDSSAQLKCTMCDTVAEIFNHSKYPQYYSIRYSKFIYEVYNNETLLTCSEVQIKKLLE